MSETRFQPTSRSRDAKASEVEPARGLPLGQIALLISLNALLSLVISVGVVLVAGPYLISGRPDNLAPSEATSAEVALAGSPGPGRLLPTQTFTPVPAEPEFYIVQPGDSLSAIAAFYGISLQDLMAANGLDNPDFVQVGQELLIPLGGLPDVPPGTAPEPAPTNTGIPFDPPTPLPEDATIPSEPAVTVGPSPTPTETPTAVPTATAPPLDEVIVSVEQVVGGGDLEQEAVVLLNEGPGINLTGWTLAGSELGPYTFPNLFLWSGGSIRVHTRAGANTASDLYWNQGEPAWPTGTVLTLNDPTGKIVSSYTVP
ncbi:MAG: LysM peptidoglycan-binding domain-containing protein [Anaerolineae bacterium]